MKGEEFDYLHELVVTQELSRMGARGYQDGFGAGSWIGLTPIVNYGTAEQRKIIAPVLAGDKYICLAITEREFSFLTILPSRLTVSRTKTAFAGSDVAGVQTTAVLTPDKKVRISLSFGFSTSQVETHSLSRANATSWRPGYLRSISLSMAQRSG